MSAPSGPVQVGMPGLLGLLQLKNSGQNPDVLAGHVQPTTDALDFWLRAGAQDETRAFGTPPAGTNDDNAFIPITLNGAGAVVLGPSSREWWFVEHFAVQVGYDGGGGSNWRGGVLGMRTQNPTTRFMSFMETQFEIAAGVTTPPNRLLVTARRFWMPPSSFLGVYGMHISDGYANVTWLRYTPLPL